MGGLQRQQLSLLSKGAQQILRLKWAGIKLVKASFKKAYLEGTGDKSV